MKLENGKIMLVGVILDVKDGSIQAGGTEIVEEVLSKEESKILKELLSKIATDGGKLIAEGIEKSEPGVKVKIEEVKIENEDINFDDNNTHEEDLVKTFEKMKKEGEIKAPKEREEEILSMIKNVGKELDNGAKPEEALAMTMLSRMFGIPFDEVKKMVKEDK